MSRNVLSTVFKLLLVSLIVGLVMHWLGVTPRSLIANFGATVENLFGTLARFIAWAIDYILIGAVIVVPVWLIVFLLDRAKGKRGP
ncbi:MAG TPA: DUF6460 domain-containing protein [Alphaproteobacteria bacterium]|jgi:hypothetical protein